MLKRREKGITLLEMLLVIFIMSVAAGVAVPSLSALDDIKLELISRDLQRAIRLAQSESIRTAYPHGISIENNDGRIRLFKFDTAINYAVNNPLKKQVFDLPFGTLEQPVSISAWSIKFVSGSVNDQSTITFSAGSGTPVSEPQGACSLLEYATIELEYNGNTALLTISPVTGRVTLQ